MSGGACKIPTRPSSRAELKRVERNRWMGLVAASSGMFLASLDITVNVALPNIADSFGADAATVQWIIIFYVGSSAAMHLSLGGAADAFGLKRMFALGLALYGVAVVAIGLSTSLEAVFALRVFQAVGNGLLMALAPAIVTRLFPAEFRGRALGIMAALGTLGMISGSLGGGALVDALGWRSIFLARAPLCVAAIAFSIAALRLPTERKPSGERASGFRRFDAKGSAALFVGVGALILTLSLGGRNGWASPYVIALAALSAGGLAAFAAIERRSGNPLLPLSVLKQRRIAIALIVSMAAMLASFVHWFVLPFFVVDTLGAAASVWGALLMLMTIASAVSSPLGGWLSDRMPPCWAISAGLAVSAISIAILSAMDERSGVARIAVGLTLAGVGSGLFQTANANLIMGVMPANRLGIGGGVIGLSRGLGTVFSVAILGAAFAAREDVRAQAAPASEAFTLAFQDTYRIALAIAAFAFALSLVNLTRRPPVPPPH